MIRGRTPRDSVIHWMLLGFCPLPCLPADIADIAKGLDITYLEVLKVTRVLLGK